MHNAVGGFPRCLASGSRLGTRKPWLNIGHRHMVTQNKLQWYARNALTPRVGTYVWIIFAFGGGAMVLGLNAFSNAAREHPLTTTGLELVNQSDLGTALTGGKLRQDDLITAGGTHRMAEMQLRSLKFFVNLPEGGKAQLIFTGEKEHNIETWGFTEISVAVEDTQQRYNYNFGTHQFDDPEHMEDVDFDSPDGEKYRLYSLGATLLATPAVIWFLIKRVNKLHFVTGVKRLALEHPVIEAKLGGNLKHGGSWEGKLEPDFASLSFPMQGSLRAGTLRVEAVKQKNQWILLTGQLEHPDGSAATLVNLDLSDIEPPQ